MCRKHFSILKKKVKEGTHIIIPLGFCDIRVVQYSSIVIRYLI